MQPLSAAAIPEGQIIPYSERLAALDEFAEKRFADLRVLAYRVYEIMSYEDTIKDDPEKTRKTIKEAILAHEVKIGKVVPDASQEGAPMNNGAEIPAMQQPPTAPPKAARTRRPPGTAAGAAPSPHPSEPLAPPPAFAPPAQAAGTFPPPSFPPHSFTPPPTFGAPTSGPAAFPTGAPQSKGTAFDELGTKIDALQFQVNALDEELARVRRYQELTLAALHHIYINPAGTAAAAAGRNTLPEFLSYLEKFIGP